MNEANQSNPDDDNDPNPTSDSERTKQVTVAGWTAGLSAFFAVGALASNPEWPVAVGVCAVAAMVAVACFLMLKR